MVRFRIKFCFALLLCVIVVQSIFLAISIEDPIHLIPEQLLRIDESLEQRLAIVIASNRDKNVNVLINNTNFGSIKPMSLVGNELDVSADKGASRIRHIYIESLKKCNRPYCLILEDDVVFIYKNIRNILFKKIISYNNDNNYVFDCSKKGILRINYKVNPNGAYCRIFSRYAIRVLIKCLPKCSKPVDICLPKCLSSFEEKRFLLTQHGGFNSSRW